MSFLIVCGRVSERLPTNQKSAAASSSVLTHQRICHNSFRSETQMGWGLHWVGAVLTKPVIWILSLQCPIQLLTDGYLSKVSTFINYPMAWAMVRSEMGSQPGWVLLWLWTVLCLCFFQGLWVNRTSFFNFLPFSPSYRSHFRTEWKLLPFWLDLPDAHMNSSQTRLCAWLAGRFTPQALSLSGEMLLKVLYHWLHNHSGRPGCAFVTNKEIVKWGCLDLHGKLSLSSAK